MSAPTMSSSSAPAPEMNGAPLSSLLQEIQAKHDRLDKTVRELREQVAALEALRKKLEIERDEFKEESRSYQLALLDVLRKHSSVPVSEDILLTKAKLKEMERTGVSFDEVMKQLEAH